MSKKKNPPPPPTLQDVDTALAIAECHCQNEVRSLENILGHIQRARMKLHEYAVAVVSATESAGLDMELET